MYYLIDAIKRKINIENENFKKSVPPYAYHIIQTISQGVRQAEGRNPRSERAGPEQAYNGPAEELNQEVPLQLGRRGSLRLRSEGQGQEQEEGEDHHQ